MKTWHVQQGILVDNSILLPNTKARFLEVSISQVFLMGTRKSYFLTLFFLPLPFLLFVADVVGSGGVNVVASFF